jgi:hypothetical protein
MTKIRVKYKMIVSSENTPLEKRYILTQAIASFSGILILIPIVDQNIKDSGYTWFNIVTIGVIVLLGMLALTFWYSTIFKHPKRIMIFSRLVLRSNWGSITLLFFYFTWAMNIYRLIIARMREWQIWPVVIIGVVLIITSVWNLLFLPNEMNTHSKKFDSIQ